MIGLPMSLQTPPRDSSRSALELIHRLVFLPAEEHPNLDGLLKELSAAFAATAAGLATFPEGAPLCIHPTLIDDCQLVIEDLKSWLNQQSTTNTPQSVGGVRTVPRRAGGSCLVTLLGIPERGGWLLWLEDDGRATWSTSEAGLLALAGQALTHRLTRDEASTPWAVQLDRGIRRQRMETAGNVVRRLAHDFGNVLTGILGFSELALADKEASRSPLRDYLSEVYRSAQSGAQYTNQLRLLARRQANSNRSCNLANVLAEFRKDEGGGRKDEQKEATANSSFLPPPSSFEWGADVQVKLHLPDDLPDVAVDSDALRQVLTIVLDNAREAIVGAGVIDISARTLQVSAGEAGALLGDVRPGKHLEIRVADNGAGLTPEVQRQLFAEPFFSTKSRKRGFGLAIAYGILSAFRGGLELLARLKSGTIARLVVPVAAVAGPSLNEGVCRD
jgi:signal transduction histidine kinase